MSIKSTTWVFNMKSNLKDISTLLDTLLEVSGIYDVNQSSADILFAVGDLKKYIDNAMVEELTEPKTVLEAARVIQQTLATHDRTLELEAELELERAKSSEFEGNMKGYANMVKALQRKVDKANSIFKRSGNFRV